MALTTPYYSAENGKRGTPGSSFYFSSPCRGPARAQGHPAWVHSSEEEEERGTTNDDEKHRRFYRPPYNRSGDKGERGGGGGKRMGHGNLRHGMHSHTDEVRREGGTDGGRAGRRKRRMDGGQETSRMPWGWVPWLCMRRTPPSRACPCLRPLPVASPVSVSSHPGSVLSPRPF